MFLILRVWPLPPKCHTTAQQHIPPLRSTDSCRTSSIIHILVSVVQGQYHSIVAKPSVLQASRRVKFKFTHCNQKVSNVSLWLETIWQKWSNPNHQWESWFEAWLSFADAMIFCHEIQTRCVVNTVHSLYPVSVDKLYGKILTDQNDLKTSSSIQVYLRVLRIQNVLYEF